MIQAQLIDNKIFAGTIDSIQLTILNEERKLWVYVPNSGSADQYSQQKYPAIYLLDGITMLIPEMIIVGIPNTNRFRDLTPTKLKPSGTWPFPPSAGGGEAFTSFIEKELMPYIESKHPTAPHRMMVVIRLTA